MVVRTVFLGLVPVFKFRAQSSRNDSYSSHAVQPHPPPTLTPTPQQPEAQAVTSTAPTLGTEEASLTGSQVREEGTAVEPPEESPELGQPDWKPADSGEGEGEEQGGGDEEVGLEEQGGWG